MKAELEISLNFDYTLQKFLKFVKNYHKLQSATKDANKQNVK